MSPKVICSICLEDLFEDTGIMAYPCGHVFGETCFEAYKGHTCPLCNNCFSREIAMKLYLTVEEDINTSGNNLEDKFEELVLAAEQYTELHSAHIKTEKSHRKPSIAERILSKANAFQQIGASKKTGGFKRLWKLAVKSHKDERVTS